MRRNRGLLRLASTAAALAPTGAVAAESTSPAPSPYEISATYTVDLWRNVSGGRKVGSRVLDNLDLTLAVDGEQAFGWADTEAFVYVLYNNGTAMSDPLVGEFQTVSNIETGVRALRLYEAWVQKRFAGGGGSLKIGLYDLNSEFDATETAGMFLNASHGIGPDFSQSGVSGPSIFPTTSLAIRGELKLDELTLRAALLDGVPGDPRNPARTAVRFDRKDGALMVAEVEREGPRATFSLGGWRYTAGAEKILETAAAGAPVRRRGNWGAYATLEGRLLEEADRGDQGLSGWIRLGHADPAFNPVTTSVSGGLVYTGLVPGRDRDQAGLAFALARFGGSYRAAARMAGAPSQRSELNLELSYRAPVTSRLTVQPDLQYVIRPGGDPSLRNALAAGVRLELSY